MPTPFFMAISRTRLRFIKSKDPDRLVEYLSVILPYKIEIKGNPVFSKGKWYLWFVLPENDKLEEAAFGDID